ncbi:MAG TPA: hypothetical protein V6D21_05925, partial [Candidatus Obscuribacterales bacterium]
PRLVKYIPNWLERFYPSMAQFAKGEGYPCGNQGVFIPKNRKCWTHPKTGQRLKKPLTYQMYQEAKVKSQRSRTERGRTALDRREQELKGLKAKNRVPMTEEDLLIEAKAKRGKLVQLLDEFESKGHLTGDGEYFIFSDPDSAMYPERHLQRLNDKYKKEVRSKIKANLDNDSIVKEQERILKATKEVKKDFDNFLRRARKLVQVENPTNINVNSLAKPGSSEDKAIRRGVKEFEKLVDIPTLRADVKVSINQDATSQRSGYNRNSGIVSLSRQQIKSGVIVHEMGHWLQYNDLELSKEVRDFYLKRTAGEKLTPLNSVVENGSYKPTELTKVDKWIHPYMGKIGSSPDSSEVLSMGLELMHGNPAYLAKKDPEMFDFIYKAVRRGIRRK